MTKAIVFLVFSSVFGCAAAPPEADPGLEMGGSGGENLELSTGGGPGSGGFGGVFVEKTPENMAGSGGFAPTESGGSAGVAVQAGGSPGSAGANGGSGGMVGGSGGAAPDQTVPPLSCEKWAPFTVPAGKCFAVPGPAWIVSPAFVMFDHGVCVADLNPGALRTDSCVCNPQTYQVFRLVKNADGTRAEAAIVDACQ